MVVPAPATPQRGQVADRLLALPDHRLLDTLLRSRAWIWLLGTALLGIVAMQVSLLKMNAGIGRAVQAGAALEHANARLGKQVAELSSGERIRLAAADMGLITPEAGSIGYLTARPGIDPLRAAQNMTEPSAAARALLSNGGRLPSTTATAATAATATTTAPAATPAAASPAPEPVAPTGAVAGASAPDGQ